MEEVESKNTKRSSGIWIISKTLIKIKINKKKICAEYIIKHKKLKCFKKWEKKNSVKYRNKNVGI